VKELSSNLIQAAWNECRKTFGEGNVLIVSNSAGTSMDPGGIQVRNLSTTHARSLNHIPFYQSESVSHHLQVPVLQHRTLKPAYSCISSIRAYFSSLHRPISDDELVIVGDRIFTDVVLANRMRLTNPKLRSDPSNPRGLLRETFSSKEADTDKGSVREKHLAEGRGPLAVWTSGVWQKEAMGMRWFEKKTVEAVEKWSTRTSGDHRGTSRFIRRIKVEEPKPNVLAQLWTHLSRTRA